MNDQFTNQASSEDGLEFGDRVSFPSFFEQQPRSSAPFSGEHREYYPMLNYINRILMEEEEENMDEHSGSFHDPMALRAAEKSLYELLGKDCPPSPSDQPLPELEGRTKIPPSSTDTAWSENHSILDLDPRNLSRMQCSSFLSESDALLQFKKGLEEGNKFLPAGNPLVFDLDQYIVSSSEEPNEEVMANGGKNRLDRGSSDEIDAGRSNKQSAFSSNDVELAEAFEKIIVFFEDFEEPCFAIDSEDPTGSLQQPGEPLQESKDRKISMEKKATETSADLDLSSLLITCAECVVAGDHKSANEKLKLVRHYSSSTGNAQQRLAVPFTNALEARLKGMEPEFYGSMSSKLTSAAEELKAFRVYLCAPFRQISAFFTNKMILDASSEAEKIHIIDFGIGYGFHWPGLIDQLCSRPGGAAPPRLRITGIDIPQPGFRPAERIQQTGRHLAKHCEKYNVTFEYQAITVRYWHRISIEELKLEENEWLAVNCQFRLRSLLEDQTAEEEDDSKDAVLRIIREMKPDICLTEVVSAQFGGPFFLGRFREALHFFSTLFDLVEHNLPREDKYRRKYEEYLGHAVMNVVACEDSARVERPETYRQWEARYKRAGFRALPLNHDMVKELRNIVKEGYHPDFMFHEDGCWILEGWKGKTITAVSCWLPAH